MATIKPPAEIVQFASRRVLYFTGGDRHKPEVKLVEHEGGRGERLYQVEIAHGLEQFEQVQYAMPGKTAARRSPEHILSEIDPNVDFRGKRPGFLHQFFQPRVVPRMEPPLLRRFNGKHVRPTYVFGNDDRQPYRDVSYPWGCVGKKSSRKHRGLLRVQRLQ
jgi:hypothetical protein